MAVSSRKRYRSFVVLLILPLRLVRKLASGDEI
jgi:hypothetical protein